MSVTRVCGQTLAVLSFEKRQTMHVNLLLV